jgi:hypothetical protein
MLLALTILAIPVVTPAVLPTSAYAAATVSDLGDLSTFEAIATDTLELVSKGDLAAARKRVTVFESAWDSEQPRLYPLNKKEWGVIDDAADAAIASLRAKKPDAVQAKATLAALIAALQDPVAK